MSVSVRHRPHGAGHEVAVNGVVTAKELKTGLLQIVRHDGWSEPCLWDFREYTDLRVGLHDLAETVHFINHFMGHFPSRGKVAIVVNTAAGRAAAMTYRELKDDESRQQVAVFDTVEEADAWLDSVESPAPQAPRAKRVALAGAIASLEGVACEVCNVSRSGALLSSPEPVALGRECTLRLQYGPTSVDVRVRVARAHVALTEDGMLPLWQIAVAYVSPAEAIEQVAQLIITHHR